jgi:UDP-N-acetylmuramoyl-tripeptide--D-alanyl-D-alanine ligase
LSRIYIFSIFILILICFYQYTFCLVPILTALCPTIANAINIVDKIKNLHYIKQAKQKLKSHHCQIIAITGSNGKTSVKNILFQMLSTQHTTQATPASFNTPLGISKFINQELNHNTEFLILEYGARHKNDIKKLCKLFGADFGIITTISPQHLETFKNLENITKAKFELAKHLNNKPCVFNIDNLYTLRMFNKKTGQKLSVSTKTKANAFASNIKIENCKTTFDLHFNNKIYSLKTSLLGNHNILNICLATVLASYLEISDANIINSISNLQQVEHRLSLIKSHINILDDTYNCSASSAREALKVLKQFPNKKMIATPGIIECGKSKYKINFDLGKQMNFCDYIIIIGNENKKAILDGIKNSANTSKTKPQIFLSPTIEESKQHFAKLNNNDTLLLLNDLPDDYK